MNTKIRIQPRMPGTSRIPVSASLAEEIEACIRADMKMFRVSRSYVIANHLAYIYNIKVTDYRKPTVVRRNANPRKVSGHNSRA